jgi:hypothetical protein
MSPFACIVSSRWAPTWYAPFEGNVGASPSYPLNETRGSADFDAYWVPWPARARPDAAAGAFEPYLLGGLGALWSRPVSVVDRTNRTFDSDNVLVDLCVGIGARLFVAEWAAIALELRDLSYFERTESRFVSSNPRDRSLWSDAGSHFTNAVQLRLGVSFFIGG